MIWETVWAFLSLPQSHASHYRKAQRYPPVATPYLCSSSSLCLSIPVRGIHIILSSASHKLPARFFGVLALWIAPTLLCSLRHSSTEDSSAKGVRGRAIKAINPASWGLSNTLLLIGCLVLPSFDSAVHPVLVGGVRFCREREGWPEFQSLHSAHSHGCYCGYVHHAFTTISFTSRGKNPENHMKMTKSEDVLLAVGIDESFGMREDEAVMNGIGSLY